MFSNWFKNKGSAVDIPDLTDIKIDPDIVLPEPTQRELYDDEVVEVKFIKAKQLILEGLKDLINDTPIGKLHEEAIKYKAANPSCTPFEMRIRFFSAYMPKVSHLGELGDNEDDCYHVRDIYTIRNLSEALTTKYLGENTDVQ